MKKLAMTLIKIVRQYLRANGYDGLYNADGECGCKVNDLMTCNYPGMRCKPGYLAPCPKGCGEHDWHIQGKKP